MHVRITAAVGVLVCIFALAPTAGACSCGGGDPRELLTQAKGAFVGTVTEEATPEREQSNRDENVPLFLTFAVERAIKGEIAKTVRVRSGSTGVSACELSLSKVQRVGLLLDRYEGDWTAGLCSQVDPRELIKAGAPPPTPSGEGPPAFLATTNGEHSVVTLDRSGRLLKYGDGKDYVRFDVCPGADWVAEIDEVSGFVNGRPYIAAGRRHVESLAMEDEKRLVPFELPEPDEPFGADVISCRDSTASEMYVFGEHPGDDDDLILRLKDGGLSETWKGQAAAVAFADDRDVVYLAKGKSGDERDIVEVDLVSGEERPIGTLPGQVLDLALQPNGSLLAGVYGTGEVRMPNRTFVAHLFVLDPAGQQPRSVEAGDGGSAAWLTEDRLAFSGWQDGIDIYDTSLTKVTAKPDWKGAAAASDEYIYGAWDDAVHYSSIDEGPVRTLSELNLSLGSLSVVSPPDPVPSQATTSADPVPLTRVGGGLRPLGWALIGALALGSLGSLAALARRRSATG